MRLLPCASLPSCPPFGTGSSPQHASFPAAAVMRAIQPTTLLPSPPQPPSLTGSVFWSLPRLHGTLFSHLFKTPFNSSQAAPLSLQPPCHSSARHGASLRTPERQPAAGTAQGPAAAPSGAGSPPLPRPALPKRDDPSPALPLRQPRRAAALPRAPAHRTGGMRRAARPWPPASP